ncbi:MAG: 30S ribosomal protein S18 [Candidatus Omnitrophota bacterium]
MRPVSRNKKRTKSLRQVWRKKVCRLCREKVTHIDYKDVKRLEKFMTDRCKIFSRRSSGNCALHQRMVARAIKLARFAAILPYIKYTK